MRTPAAVTARRTGVATLLMVVTLGTGCAATATPHPISPVPTVAPTLVHTPTADSAAPHSATSVAPLPATPTADSSAAQVLQGIPQIPSRISHGDYRRAAFGDTWTDDQDAPGGHNGCDTRNDILERDLVDKTYTPISRCPHAVATGTLHDPYTGTDIAFIRGSQTGAAVQIDHIVPLAYAWDMGARGWTDQLRARFANDPANLLAVEGDTNQSKGDKSPALWMPPNSAFDCQYAARFVDVLSAYSLPIDAQSATALATVLRTCPLM